MKKFTFFDFCSGIGGGRLGMEQAGFQCVGYADTSYLSVDTYNQMHNTNGERNFKNVKRIKCDELPQYDIMVAGFPCQTFSVIGKRTGFKENNGQIIFHLIRIISETKPKCFLLENVRGLVSHDKGKSLQTILYSLEQEGYFVSYKVINSIEHGTPQMRQRVYIVGFRNDIAHGAFEWPEPVNKPPLSKYLVDEKNEIDEETLSWLIPYLNNDTNKGKYTVEDFIKEEYLIVDTRMSDVRLYENRVPTLRSQRDGIFYVRNKQLHYLTGYEALLLQGFSREYADKVKNTVTNRHLLMQAGNAMTVPVIKAIGEKIYKYLREDI